MNHASQHEGDNDVVRRRPSTRELVQSVREQAPAIFPLDQELTLTALTVAPRLDAPDVLLVTGADGCKRAVLACSSPAAPDMVARAMARARRAFQLVPGDVGRHIVKPLAEGNMSMAVAARRIGAESSATRALIVDAAEQVMLEEGYAAASTRRVAARAATRRVLVAA